jgi:hypothetical protein
MRDNAVTRSTRPMKAARTVPRAAICPARLPITEVRVRSGPKGGVATSSWACRVRSKPSARAPCERHQVRWGPWRKRTPHAADDMVGFTARKASRLAGAHMPGVPRKEHVRRCCPRAQRKARCGAIIIPIHPRASQSRRAWSRGRCGALWAGVEKSVRRTREHPESLEAPGIGSAGKQCGGLSEAEGCLRSSRKLRAG